MTLWTSGFAQQSHHYSFAREKSNDDTKKRQEEKNSHSGRVRNTRKKGGKTEL